MPDLPLGRIARIEVREAWPHEAHDFTPWLAEEENFQPLAEALHFFEVEVEATEEAVGDFSADIIARDRDGLILIENQLAQTDHTHLGQILTYLAGFDEPARVVWISTKVREEHRAAVDWLNANTPSGFAFFAVELELFKIGDGPVAPHYYVVAKPNEWSRHVSAKGRQIANEGQTPSSKTYKALWTGLNDYLLEHEPTHRNKQPSTASWWSFAIGRTGFNLATLASARDDQIAFELYCGFDGGKVIFDHLMEDRGEIERAIGEPVTWERVDGKTAWRLILRKPNSPPSDQSRWPEYFVWYHDKLLRFRDAFRGRLKALDYADLDLNAANEAGEDA